MKKRLLLILAISISFAPAVWADNGYDLGGLRRFNAEDQPLNAPGLLCEDGGATRPRVVAGESSGSTILTASLNSGAAEAPPTTPTP